MSLPPEPPPESPSGPAPAPASGGNRNRTVLVVLAAAVVLAVVAALVFVSTRGGDTKTAVDSPRPVQSGATASPSASPHSGTDPELARFYHQKLSWTACGRDRCTRLTVPLDYTRPGGATLDLAVLEVPAQGKRIGALVVNPGGPGGSGVNFAAAGSLQFGAPLSAAFDIVGFDPRGVGRSNPVKCLDTAQLDKVVAFDPDPDTRAERNQMDALIHGFGQGCLDKSGSLAAHISTDEAARDMDILRAALGQQKLDYLGSSYGTFLGATYADLFPDHVGRFVLDGAVDPALSTEQLSLQQAHGFETALRAYVKDCVDRGSCFLGSSVDAGILKIQSLLLSVEKTPLPTGQSRQLTEGLAMLGIWMPLYLKAYWGQLSAGLRQAMNDGNGSVLLGLADTYTARGPSSYSDNSMEALYAVTCLDHDDYIPTKDVPAHFAEFLKASPTFGRAFAFSLSTCANWPVRNGRHTVALHAAGAPPIVVIGTTRDPATPLAWAQALAGELQSGRLITRDGDGHTGFRRGNSCVDNAVERWLIKGTVPAANLTC